MSQTRANTSMTDTVVDADTASGVAAGMQLRSERILAELQGIVTRMSGKDVPLYADTRIDKHLSKLGQWEEEIDVMDLGFRIESAFGVRFDTHTWNQIGGLYVQTTHEVWENVYGKDFTFGKLAGYIADRVNRSWTDDDRKDPLEPLVILGKPCKVAGVYRTLEHIARTQNENVGKKHFGPSTPIKSILRGEKLRRFWANARWLSDFRIPPLGRPTRTIADYLFNAVMVICGLAVLLTLIGAGLSALSKDGGVMWSFFGSIALLFVPLALACLMLMIPGSLVSYLFKMGDHDLPYGITTFADLARRITGVHGGYCAKCRYDLTGNTSGVCPECGEPVPAPSERA